jgi:hypothetical protein
MGSAGGRPTLRQSADEDALSSREPKPPALPLPLATPAGQRREQNRTREATATQILLEGLDSRTPDDGADGELKNQLGEWICALSNAPDGMPPSSGRRPAATYLHLLPPASRYFSLDLLFFKWWF